MIDYIQSFSTNILTIVFNNFPKDNIGHMITYIVIMVVLFELFKVIGKRIINVITKII